MTGVILNWKRPGNVHRILASWRMSGLIDEAIVWNNNAQKPFCHPWATVINSKRDEGLYSRFLAARRARHDCILIQDDDLEIPALTLKDLKTAWASDPDVLHGIFGRVLSPEGRYERRNTPPGKVPVVLTRALLMHRRYATQFFRVAPRFESLQRSSRPRGNGEDILLSYIVMRLSGRLNRVYDLPVTELPAPHAIHHRKTADHNEHRTRLMKACESWRTLESDRKKSKKQEEFICRFIAKPPAALYDIGVGAKSEWQSLKARYPAMGLFGCEPHPGQFNALRDRFPGTLVPVALGDGDGEAILHVPTDKPMCSSLHPISYADASYPVKTWSLDQFDENMGRQKRILLWMDIEGSELQVLMHGPRLLKSERVRWINLEVRNEANSSAPGWCNPRELHAFLENHGYVRKAVYNRHYTHEDVVYVHEEETGCSA